MPLNDEGAALIRANVEQLQRGRRARLVVIGRLTATQLDAINIETVSRGYPPMAAEVVFTGRHVYQSRIVRDGYDVEDVVDQIRSALSSAAVVIATPHMTAIENPLARQDRYGNAVHDRAVFECSARYPRPELFSVIPKGDLLKAKTATQQVSGRFNPSGSTG